MIKLKKYIFFSIILITPLMIAAQEVTLADSLQVKATVIEQLQGGLRSLPNLSISIKNVGTYTTNAVGDFSFSIQLKDNLEQDVAININSLDYEITQPFEGKITIDTTHIENGISIVVLGKDVEQEYKDQITKLGKRLRKIQAVSKLTTRRLNAINDSLLQVIHSQAVENKTLRSTIEELKQTVAQTEEEKALLGKKVESLEMQLQVEKNKNDELQDQLAEALAENLRLQEEYLSLITGALNKYLVTTKDVQTLLLNVKQYSKSKAYAASYNNSLQAYNDIFSAINEAHQGYIQNVKSSWKSERVAKAVETTFNILFDQLHYPTLEPTFLEVNTLLNERKIKKAHSLGAKKFDELAPIIRHLESNVKRLTKTMTQTIR